MLEHIRTSHEQDEKILIGAKELAEWLKQDSSVRLVDVRSREEFEAVHVDGSQLLSQDLMRRIRWWNRPMDTALPHLLTDARQARTTVLDGLHIRVVDLPAALEGRRYAAPVDVVLEVDDPLCEWNTGRWHLRGDADNAQCTRSDDEPTLRLSMEDLGAVYLGGTTLSTLAEAGRVKAADEKTLEDASMAFGWRIAPWCPVVL